MSENLDRSDIREEELLNPGVTYERTQADLRIVYGFLVGLALNVALVFFVLWGFYAWFRAREGRSAVPAPVTYSVPPALPTPILQPDPVADYNQMRVNEDQWLSTYGWVDQKQGIARIPIDRAMDLLVKRGLPHVSPSNPNPAAGPYPGAQRVRQNIEE